MISLGLGVAHDNIGKAKREKKKLLKLKIDPDTHLKKQSKMKISS